MARRQRLLRNVCGMPLKASEWTRPAIRLRSRRVLVSLSDVATIRPSRTACAVPTSHFTKQKSLAEIVWFPRTVLRLPKSLTDLRSLPFP